VVVNEINKYYYKYKIVDSFEALEDDILKIAVLDVKGAEANSYNKFYTEFKDRLEVIVSGKIWLDLYNKGTSKGVAIKLLQDRFGIKKEETMVFGDYYNDIEMFKMAHYSYAMANAPKGVKDHAKFLARSNNENGVIRVIKDIVLDGKSEAV
jgi:Cof subfamily protein (haloacid dehalogenase superfamily)